MKLSVSGIERAMACIASVVLPYSGRKSAAGTLGTVIHDFLANVITVGREEALVRVPEEHRAACEGIDVSLLPACDPSAFAAEVAFSYDVQQDTARELGRGLGRQYPADLKPWEIPGTADVIGLAGDAVLVWDYKTGFDAVAPAESNLQLRGYALAAARAYGKTRAVVGIIRLRDGNPWFDQAPLDELDLEATAAELRSLLERAGEEDKRIFAGASPRTVEGPHCKYCPAFVHCPAKMNLVRELALETKQAPTIPVLTTENAPAVLARLEAGEALLKRIREVLEDFARETPIPLGNGEVFGPCPTTRETIDPAKATMVLGMRFSEKVATDALETSQAVTKTRLKDALKGWLKENPGPKPAQLEREVLELLREKGAVRVTVTNPVRRHKPKEELGAAAPPAPVALPADTEPKPNSPEDIGYAKRAGGAA